MSRQGDIAMLETWRKRFAATRLDGAADEPGPGAPHQIGTSGLPRWSATEEDASHHCRDNCGSTFSPNSRIDAAASTSVMSLKLTCKEAISKAPICR
jgi:hypothetical protein